MTETLTDALTDLRPTSPSLAICKEATEDCKTFQITHSAMGVPDVPRAPDRVRAGRRAHRIATLKDLGQYVEKFGQDETDDQGGSVAFYTDEFVSVVLDEGGVLETETIICTMERSLAFRRWDAACSRSLNQTQLLSLLRANARSIRDAGGDAEALIGTYSHLRGTLIHDAAEFMDWQSRSATFAVKQKRGRTEKDIEIEDVPTEFRIAIPILRDDDDLTQFTVQVRMTGGEGAEIAFDLTMLECDELVSDHIDVRLADFAKEASFLCVRGENHRVDWTEAPMPKALVTLMEQQTKMLAASNTVRQEIAERVRN